MLTDDTDAPPPAPADGTVLRALDELGRQHAALFGSMPDPTFAFDLNGVFIAANEALAHLTGFALTEIIGRSFLSIVAADDRDHAWKHFCRARSGEAQSYTVWGTGRDGRDFSLAVRLVPQQSGDQVQGVYGIARETTRLTELERSLRETDERYRLLADNVQDMISLHDTEGLFLYASPSAWTLLGVHPVELIGRSVYDLIDPADVDLVRQGHAAIMQREGRGPAVFRARRADGSVGWFESTARMATDEETGTPWRIIAVTRDISERRRFEQHLLQMQKMEALGRLAGGIAHDFNNVLTVIGGHAELLTNLLGDGTPERMNAEHIREAALRARALTRQLLSYGRSEGRDVRVTDLNSVVLELQPMLARMLGDEVALNVALDPALAGVRCEPAALEQVLVNLAVNAHDAMKGRGRLNVRTQMVDFEAGEHAAIPEGRYVLLTVSDSGPGMDADVASHAFEPFFTTRPEGKGTGLGLSTVYNVVRQAEGDIELETAPGEGARFRIYLPAESAPATTSADGRLSPAGALRGTETVLVAEDDAGVRSLIVAALQRYGYRVMTAVDGMQAVELFRTFGHVIDLVVTDVNMPELKGPDMVRILAEAGSALPVLYISGFTSETLALDELAPQRAFLGKPFTPVELAQSVRLLLNAPTAEPPE